MNVTRELERALTARSLPLFKAGLVRATAPAWASPSIQPYTIGQGH